MTIRLKTSEPRKILSSSDIFTIMQRVLLQESKIDRNREHVWTISLDTANTILNIELVSMGSVNKAVVEPMEIFSVPLQKRAVSIVLVHNHPAGQLPPSEMDKDITDRLIQCGIIMHVHVLDHLIITENSYYSFRETGLLRELEKSMKYVPPYKQKEVLKKQMEEAVLEKGKNEPLCRIAHSMLQSGYPIEEITKLTGLNEQSILSINEEEEKQNEDVFDQFPDEES